MRFQTFPHCGFGQTCAVTALRLSLKQAPSITGHSNWQLQLRKQATPVYGGMLAVGQMLRTKSSQAHLMSDASVCAERSTCVPLFDITAKPPSRNYILELVVCVTMLALAPTRQPEHRRLGFVPISVALKAGRR